MNTYNPIIALILFFAVCAVLFFIFRPIKGWFWIIKNNDEKNQRIIIEDILKYLYHSEMEDKFVNIHDISRSLPDEDKKIISSLNQMAIHELVSIEGEHVKLTKAGYDYALRMVRAHRLWERFLADKTGYAEKDWHKIAEQKEHDLSLEDIESMAAKLGNPLFDPHGDPIPTVSGKMAELKGTPLSDLKADDTARIIHIKDKPTVIYQQIIAEKIHIGSLLKVVERNTERVVFHAEGESFTLAPIVAANITVSPLKKEQINEDNVARLSMLQVNEQARIIGISKEIRGESRRRLLDLGFVKGAEVSVDLPNPLGDPKAYLIKGTSIALRKNQASKILIKKD